MMKNEKRLGQIVTVVTEGWDKYAECYFGRSEYEAPEIDGKIFFTSRIDIRISGRIFAGPAG